MFEAHIIDEEREGDKEGEIDNSDEKEDMEDEDGVWNLKINIILKGMVELERIFENDESARHRRPPPKVGNDDCDSFNLGS